MLEFGNFEDTFDNKLRFMDVDWSTMPVDILDQIAGKLIHGEDLIAFSVICRSWYSAYEHAKHRWSPRMPWLMLAEDTQDNPDHFRKFYDPCSGKCYRLKVLETFMCWGSAYGWIIAMNLDFEIFMFNPLTRVRVELPSTRTLPSPLNEDWIIEDDPEDFKLCCHATLDRVILLKIPRVGSEEEGEEEEFLVVSFSGDGLDIGIAKPNDLRWTPIIREDKETKRTIISDVVYKNGGLLLLARKGTAYRVELNHGAMNMNSLVATYYSPPPREIPRDTPYSRSYITQSSGDLLAVWRFSYLIKASTLSKAKDPVYKTRSFFIFKFNDEAKVWDPLKDLGEISIFVGSNSTMAIQAHDDCRSSCIYFTDDLWELWSFPRKFGGHDMGIFDIDNNLGKNRLSTVFESLYEGEDSRARFCCPLWFIPKF